MPDRYSESKILIFIRNDYKNINNQNVKRKCFLLFVLFHSNGTQNISHKFKLIGSLSMVISSTGHKFIKSTLFSSLYCPHFVALVFVRNHSFVITNMCLKTKNISISDTLLTISNSYRWECYSIFFFCYCYAIFLFFVYHKVQLFSKLMTF